MLDMGLGMLGHKDGHAGYGDGHAGHGDGHADWGGVSPSSNNFYYYHYSPPPPAEVGSLPYEPFNPLYSFPGSYHSFPDSLLTSMLALQLSWTINSLRVRTK